MALAYSQELRSRSRETVTIYSFMTGQQDCLMLTRIAWSARDDMRRMQWSCAVYQPVKYEIWQRILALLRTTVAISGVQ